MTLRRRQSQGRLWQTGLTYIEVMIATAIIAVALIPAIEALQTSMLGTEVYESATANSYAALSRMETVLAEPQSALLRAAAIAGDETTPSSYSDPPATATRSLVYISLYDPENSDGDGDMFTVADPNLDGDNDPFTGYPGLLWIRIEIEGSVTHIESLTAP